MNKITQGRASWRRVVLLGAIVGATVAAAGCSSGGDGDDGGSQTSQVSGSAVKGLLSGATVEVFAIANGAVSSTVLQTGTTNEDGSYSLTLDNYNGPVKVVVTTSADTVMTCDALNGCGQYDGTDSRDLNSDGNIDFGEKFTLGEAESGMQISALLPAVTAGSPASVNLSPVTTMAAQFAEQAGSLNATGITGANERVRRLLNITSDIVTTPAVNVTAVAEGDLDNNGGLELASISAAIASLARENATSFKQTLESLAQSFANNNGELVNNSSSETLTLANLTQRASQVLDQAEQQSGVNMDSVQSKFTAMQAIADAQAPDSVSSTPDAADDDNLTLARSLVQDVRTWYQLIKREGEGKAQGFQSNLEDAEQTLDATLELSSIESTVFSGLFRGFNVAVSFSQERWSESVSDSVSLADSISEVDTSNLEVELDGNEVTVTGSVDGNTVDMLLVFNPSPGPRNATSVTVDVSGTVENDVATLTLATSSGQSNTVSFTFDEAVNLSQVSTLDPLLYESAMAYLNARMVEKGDNPVTFEGDLTLELMDGTEAGTGDLLFEGVFSTAAGDSFTGELDIDTEFYPGEDAQSEPVFNRGTVALGGVLALADGTGFDGSISARIESAVDNDSETVQTNSDGNPYLNLMAASLTGLLTDSDSQRMYLSLSLDLDEQGNPAPQTSYLNEEAVETSQDHYTVDGMVTMFADFTDWPLGYIQFGVQRRFASELEDGGTGTLTFSWDGTLAESNLTELPQNPQRQLVVTFDTTADVDDAESNNITFTATNNDTQSSMTFSITCEVDTEECDSNRDEGDIKVNGEIVADIVYRPSINAYTVNYTDGTFETF